MASSDSSDSRPNGPVVITDAQTGRSRDFAGRQKRYAITMGFRTLCFICMIFVSGPWRWVLLAGAVFLPYVAVILANQVNSRTEPPGRVEHGEPTPAPQLDQAVAAELIDGSDLVDAPPQENTPS